MVSPLPSLPESSVPCSSPEVRSGETLPGETLLAWRRCLLNQGGQSGDLDWLLDLAGGLGWAALQRLRLEPATPVRLTSSRQQLEAIWCRHLQQAEPLQYLVGICPWRDLELRVAPGVLIPRQETELLVDLALASLSPLSAERNPIQHAAEPAVGQTGSAASREGQRPTTVRAGLSGMKAQVAQADRAPSAGDYRGVSADQNQEVPSLLWADLGTGSGCLALALARAMPWAQGLAVDRSDQALAQAAHNLALYDQDRRVRLRQGDWWSGLEPWWGQIDLVVANPPYIPSAVMAALDPVVRDHEPRLALDGGVDGLEAIRAIAAGAPRALAPGGVLLLEHHHDQSAAVMALLTQAGLEDASAHSDLEGTLRFARAYRSRDHG